MMIEPLQPGDQPAAVGLQEDELGLGKALAYPACEQERNAAHDIDGSGDALSKDVGWAELGVIEQFFEHYPLLRIVVVHIPPASQPGPSQMQAPACAREVG